MTARIFMLLKSRASPDLLPFSLCNKKILAIRHLNRPLFPTTLSIPSCGIGKYVGLGTYLLPLVQISGERQSTRWPRPDYVECVFVSLGSVRCNYVIICRVDSTCEQRPSCVRTALFPYFLLAVPTLLGGGGAEKKITGARTRSRRHCADILVVITTTNLHPI